MICKYCGADNNENRRICKGCGRQLYEEYSRKEYNQYEQIPKKKKNTLLWVCLGAGIVAVLAILAASILLFSSGAAAKKYSSRISQAEKYVAAMDYESAIRIYNEAIELEPTNSEAYIKLANVYISMDNIAKAQEIAILGFEKTHDSVLQDIVNRLFGGMSYSDENGEITVNSALLTQVSTGKYSELVQSYGAANISIDNGLVKVVYANLKGAVYYGASSVDANTNQPLENAVPEYIILTDINQLIVNFNGYLSVDTLSELFKNTIQVNMVDSIQCATLEYLNCRISIQCDAGGNVNMTSPYVKIVPLGANYDADLNSLKGNAAGIITDSSNNSAIVNAHLTVRSGADVKTGAVVAETDTDAKGAYTLNLSEGKYTVCVSKSGYKDQYFIVTVNKGMTMSGQNYAMTGDGSNNNANEIRLVMEWGSTPNDLDLHIQGQTELGTFIGVFGYGGRNMSAVENGVTVAKLDKNETSGNGKETITITGTALSGRYAVHIHDQTNRNSHLTTVLSESGAVLKVYLPGESTPHVYNVPTNTEGTCWYVCNIINGKITIPPASNQMRYSTIG